MRRRTCAVLCVYDNVCSTHKPVYPHVPDKRALALEDNRPRTRAKTIAYFLFHFVKARATTCASANVCASRCVKCIICTI